MEGFVRDEANPALPYATVAIGGANVVDNCKQLIYADSTGYYRFEKLDKGKYILTTSYMRYTEKISDTISINEEKPAFKYDFILIAHS